MPPVSYLSGVWYRLCQRFFMDDQIESADLYKKHQIMLKHSISPRMEAEAGINSYYDAYLCF